MRLHELAKELGMTNQEVVDLCGVLGVPVKSHSSSLNEAYADMVRRRAVRQGLTRTEQPDEPKLERAKKSTAKKSAAHPDAEQPAETPATEAPQPQPAVSEPVAEAPQAPVSERVAESPQPPVS